MLLGQLQGTSDRQARQAEHSAELFLSDPSAGRERAIGHRLDQPLVSAVYQRRFEVEKLQWITQTLKQNPRLEPKKLLVKPYRMKFRSLEGAAAQEGANGGRSIRRRGQD